MLQVPCTSQGDVAVPESKAAEHAQPEPSQHWAALRAERWPPGSSQLDGHDPSSGPLYPCAGLAALGQPMPIQQTSCTHSPTLLRRSSACTTARLPCWGVSAGWKS